MLRTAAAAVKLSALRRQRFARTGVLDEDPEAHFPAPEEIYAELAPAGSGRIVECADRAGYRATEPGGRNAVVVDNILLIRFRTPMAAEIRDRTGIRLGASAGPAHIELAVLPRAGRPSTRCTYLEAGARPETPERPCGESACETGELAAPFCVWAATGDGSSLLCRATWCVRVPLIRQR
ncbi:hypothetical protein [Nocardia carnea]|uniref:hypothetical protein n=1 Tax=Nocardia carnea TaxID=37328 RepID=UPI0024564E16|nr:hypothetical protein [Nocardia carnea]